MKISRKFCFITIISVLFFGYVLNVNLSHGGLYSIRNGFDYKFSYNLHNREDFVRQVVYKSMSYSSPGFERGGGWGPSWDKIEVNKSNLTNEDVSILISMINKEVKLNAKPGDTISITITWILTQLNSEFVISEYKKALLQYPDSYYLEYGLDLANQFSH